MPKKDDAARRYTNSELRKIENRIKKHYSQANDEITAEWNNYMLRMNEELRTIQTAMRRDPKNKALQDEYQRLLESRMYRDQRYREMIDDTVYRITNANTIARNYVNGSLPDIYVHNYLQVNTDINKLNVSMGMSFSIRDEATIRRLITDGEIQIPKGITNALKDTAYNRRRLNSTVLQGILQGESIPEISKRIRPIVNNNRSVALRVARTLVTGAENRGRQDSYRELADDGVVMNKVWIATPDGRTRDWHLDMDGQEVGVNDDFIDGLGNELEYPGDPSAPGETVYNCRCSMRTNILGFKGRNGKIYYTETRQQQTDLHRSQIENERKDRANNGD